MYILNDAMIIWIVPVTVKVTKHQLGGYKDSPSKKTKILSSFTHLHAIPDVYDFLSSHVQRWIAFLKILICVYL